MVNIAEEYAALYLRLNGFLVLPNFTHLSHSGHAKESDIIGLRCPNSIEKVNGDIFPIDNSLFSNDMMNKSEVIPIICEVKGGTQKPKFQANKIRYIKNFFGDLGENIIFMGVSQAYDSPIKTMSNGTTRINIGLSYIISCTKGLIRRRAQICNKRQSWYLNEGLLQELIFEENSPD